LPKPAMDGKEAMGREGEVGEVQGEGERGGVTSPKGSYAAAPVVSPALPARPTKVRLGMAKAEMVSSRPTSSSSSSSSPSSMSALASSSQRSTSTSMGEAVSSPPLVGMRFSFRTRPNPTPSSSIRIVSPSIPPRPAAFKPAYNDELPFLHSSPLFGTALIKEACWSNECPSRIQFCDFLGVSISGFSNEGMVVSDYTDSEDELSANSSLHQVHSTLSPLTRRYNLFFSPTKAPFIDPHVPFIRLRP